RTRGLAILAGDRLVEHVAERATVGDDARRSLGNGAIDHAVGGDDTSEEQLRDDLDDAAAADPGHASPASTDRVLEVGRIRPRIDADDAEPGLERGAVDAHPLDGTRRGPLPGADLGSLERWTGRAAGCQQSIAVAEHDLGVRADIDDERHR